MQNKNQPPDFEDTHPHAPKADESLEEQIVAINKRLDAGSQRMKNMQIEIAGNTLELAANTEITTEIRDLMIAAKVGFRLMGWIGIAAAWIGKLALAGSAVAAFIYAIKHGGPPSK